MAGVSSLWTPNSIIAFSSRQDSLILPKSTGEAVAQTARVTSSATTEAILMLLRLGVCMRLGKWVGGEPSSMEDIARLIDR